MNLESEYKKEIGKQAYDKVLEKYSLGYVDWLEEKLKEQLKTNIMKASNLVFPEELITRVKKNWLTTLNYLTVGKTDNELLLEFVKLSRAVDAETGLADEISFIVMDQTIITKPLQS